MFPVGGHTNRALLTDLYELTMAAGYFESGVYRKEATFELFVRRMPPHRGYLVAAGLAPVVAYLEALRFTPEEVSWLRAQPVFRAIGDTFFAYLSALRFTGDLYAVPEGTVVFPGEPILSVTAPLIEAQIVETYLLSMITAHTMIASKAARIVDAAQGRGVVDFGSRRAHGPGAGVLAARASYIGGAIGTSNVYAGFTLGIPVFGTAAHSWTEAFVSEEAAFQNFFDRFPDHATLLIDTYDTLEGARRAAKFGPQLPGVRIDSGDLVAISKQVREILDQAGCTKTKIVASNDLDEYRIAELLDAKAPIDLFGVGTAMVTSRDAPSLDGVYKLVEQRSEEGVRYCAKFSEGKATWPGRKQIFRKTDDAGCYAGDLIGLAEEEVVDTHPLLQCVMEEGRRKLDLPPLSEIREHARKERERLPLGLRRLSSPETYPIEHTPRLETLFAQLRAEMGGAG